MKSLAAVCAVAAAAVAGSARAGDWPLFGYDAARSDAAPAAGLSEANLGQLRHRRRQPPAPVDPSPIYLADVPVRGKRHDVLVVTTTYGITIALDARSGATLWRFTPPGIRRWLGS